MNIRWLDLFPDTKVFHLPRLHSDHYPILLRTNPSYIFGEKLFRFELFWMKHHSFAHFIELAWNKYPHDLSKTIFHYKKDLMKWNIENFGNVFLEIKRLKKRLAGLQSPRLQ